MFAVPFPVPEFDIEAFNTDVETAYGPVPVAGTATNTETQVRSMLEPIAQTGTMSEITVWPSVAGDMDFVASARDGTTSTAKAVVTQAVTVSTTEPFAFNPGLAVKKGWHLGAYSKLGAARVTGGVAGLHGGAVGSSVTVGETFPANEAASVGPLIGYKITAPKIPPPETEEVKDQPRDFLNGNANQGNPGSTIPWQFQSDWTMRTEPNGGGVELVEGVDWAQRPNTGIFWRIDHPANPAAHEATVYASYTGHEHYFGKIVGDPLTGELSHVNGKGRRKDSDHYRPEVPPGKVHLFDYFVTKDGIELWPAHPFDPVTGTKAGMEGRFADWREHGRECLADARAAAEVWVFNISDSTGAIGGGKGVYQLVANGDRDRADFFTGLPVDTLTNTGEGQTFPITLYDGTITDPEAPGYDPHFAGSGFANHVKVGGPWGLVRAWERLGKTVMYRNRGTGSINSTSDFADDLYHGTHPARLDAMIAEFRPAPAVNVVYWNLGQNDNMSVPGAIDTYGNLCAGTAYVRAAALAAGKIVNFVFQTPNQINKWSLKATQEQWKAKHDEVVRAAIDSRGAYLPLFWNQGEGNEGACGLSLQVMGAAGIRHHPYPPQYAAIEAMAEQLTY